MRLWLGEGWDLRPQASGDLGARLAAAAHAVPPGRGWLAIGADCPRLDAALLREAAAVVARDEIVLGPTVDGGYYLLGGRTPLPPISSAECPGARAACSRRRARGSCARSVPWRELPSRSATWTPRRTRAPKDS